VAARLQSPQSLTEQDLKWNSGYRDPEWDPPVSAIRSPPRDVINATPQC